MTQFLLTKILNIYIGDNKEDESMGDTAISFGSIGTSSSSASTNYNSGFGNSNNAESKKLAMTGSIFQGLFPPPDASAIRA